MKPSSILSIGLLTLPPPLLAQEPISTDRPDFVESSLVVGASMVQVETSVAYERAGMGEQLWSTPTLLRIGISENLEVRAETEGLVSAQTEATPAFASTDSADVSLGLKWHRQDGGTTGDCTPSTAWLLHLDLPTGGASYRAGHAAPSLRWVAEWEPAEGWSLGVMPGLTWMDDGRGGRAMKGIFGVVVGRELGPGLRGFAELSMPEIARQDNGGTIGNIDTGLAWNLGLDTQLDAAVNFGLTDDSPDFAATLGLSHRFR